MTSLHRLDEVCVVTMGQAPKGESYNLMGDGWPLIAGAGDFSEGRPRAKKFTTEPSKISAPGDIVVGIRASIGDKVIADREYCLGRGVAGLRPHAKLDSRYLWHWLTDSAPMLALKGRGATFKQVNRQDIGEMEIPIPRLEEQRRIAAILDQADVLLAKRHQTIAQIEELTRSLFLYMFGDPLFNPTAWATSTIGGVATTVTDGEHQTPKRSSTGIRLLSARNVQNGYIDCTDVDYVDQREYDRLRRRIEPKIGDVLISCSGTIGRVARVTSPEPFAMVRSVALVRADRSVILPTFLEHQLRTSSMRSRMLLRANSSSQANLFQGQIRALPLITPPLALQAEFERRVGAVTTLALKQRDHLADLGDLFASLQSRAFIGKL